ncbi:MAG: universal stress protein [Dehalococcoidia bacterium]|nr:universal stress protein [Dehalococcoidia bacterium]MCA9855687.1 universal stress protein [Dehalococcoidia bacterium]
MYERALVPIDGSAFSRAALAHVLRLDPNAAILVTVVESVASEMARQTGIVADIPPSVARDIETTALSEHRKWLRDAEHELRQQGWDRPIEQVLREGKPGPEIVAIASEYACDVIVMATHGRTGLGRALRGSVADYVIGHMTDAVVLLVRPPNVERA